jgi:exodeoxyribonuclease-5
MSIDTGVLLCSTSRLARAFRLAQQREQLVQGATLWQPVPVQTLPQFLEGMLGQALLRGEMPAQRLPALALTTQQERILWERAIESVEAGDPAQALFDTSGMAAAAMEANCLLEEWQVALPSGEHSSETRQFLHWREQFRSLCARHDALEPVRLLNLQITLLERGAGRLPAVVHYAGFDRLSPQLQRLFGVMAARGVSLQSVQTGLDQPAPALQVDYDDAEAECRAAAAWAAMRLAQHPAQRLAIVVPELATLRMRLAAALDDALHPQSMVAAHAEAVRCYDFSLGDALAEQPIVASALALLRCAVQRHQMEQGELGWLLRNVYWSAGVSEADARARLEARLRRQLPATLGLEQALRLARKAHEEGLGIGQLLQHLNSLQFAATAWPRKQCAAAWVASLAGTLQSAGWPGERSLSSHEYQARQSWNEALAELAQLDALLSPLSAEQAVSRLSCICRERIFQPEAEHEASLQVMGLLEAAAAPFDAVWVMGMNDQAWPPPARSNALLPAAAQRQAGAPNSCSRVQAEFALVLHRRILHCAPHVVFSWSRRDGERELRPSPLLAGMPKWYDAPAPALALSQQLAEPAIMEWLDDHLAPPVLEGEQVRGGTGLLKAQAICPAWAYYRYRLGARALEEAVDGLDSVERGSLLHAVLQCFWNGRDSVWLHALDEVALQEAILAAIEQGLSQYSATLERVLPMQFLVLERQRLQALLTSWLALELQRPPFAVQECERRVRLEIAGIGVELTLDRVDALQDGRLVVLDYKTGAAVSHTSWAQQRISEPQLPIYAALALSGDQVAAVCFARIRAEEQKFLGVAAEAELLPGVKSLDEARKLFPEDRFRDWLALLGHWQTSISAVAEEVRAGEAAVRYSDEAELAWCEVRPLLRLPERKLQLERELPQ